MIIAIHRLKLKKNAQMIKKYVYTQLFLFLVICSLQMNGQSKKPNEDSNFELLKTEISKQKENALKLKLIHSHLTTAKGHLDTLKMADAYYYLSKWDQKNQATYADSLIELTRNKRYASYPARGYLLKGNHEYEEGKYPKALELYLTASKFAKQNGNEKLYFKLKFNIGLLKNTAGEREEAHIIFTEYVNFLEKNKHATDGKLYNKVLFALADAYIYNEQYDLAKTYIDKGIQNTLKIDDIELYSNFIVYSGMHEFFSKNYSRAIDSLKKGKELIQKSDRVKTRIAICDYYIARSYQDLGKIEQGLYYFKNVDSILKKTEDVIPELIDTYDYLIKYYRSKGDTELQIRYINTLLRLDSIKDSNQIYLSKNINDRYDTAELISEKEALISQLEEEKFLKENTISILIVFLSLIGLFAGYWFWRSHINKKRFMVLLEKQKNEQKQGQQDTTIPKINTKEDHEIPEEVIENVLKKLKAFENSDKYSKKHYTLNSLAKELNTNSAYLSKIINVYKHINFANYLNNLRIDFAVNQLTINKSLRSYTIRAIAEEVGFKNAQSFSSAFYKKTGIYPSYFIKRLNNNS